MSTDNNMEARLWEYIDGLSDAAEKSVIEALIRDDKEWRDRYHALLEINSLIQSDELEQPSMRFTKNVMDEISRLHIAPAAKTYINKNIIRGLCIFFVSMIVGFLVYGFGQVSFNQPSDSKLTKGIQNLDMSGIDYSVFFSNNYVNAFMMLNLILGLFLLDQLLEQKKKKLRKTERPDLSGF